MNTFSIQRPRPSMEMRTPACCSTPVNRGEVNATLVRVEDLRFPEPGQGLLQRLDAELHVHGVRYPPGQHLARPLRSHFLGCAELTLGCFAQSITATR